VDEDVWETLPEDTVWAESGSSRRAAPPPPVPSLENIYEELPFAGGEEEEDKEEEIDLANHLRAALDLRGARQIEGFTTWRVSASSAESDGIICDICYMLL